MAKLYFTYSAMNAGKSAMLLQAAHNYRERGMAVMLWTSSHHAPHPGAPHGEIASRIGLTAPARVFGPGEDLFAAIAAAHQDGAIGAVFFDEAQFLTEPQVWALARVADDLDIPVLCYGLRTDFTGALFEGAAALLALADDLREARTICWCGAKATMNLRRDSSGRAVTGGERVGVAKQSYTPLCRKHFREAMDSAGAEDRLDLKARA
ncbi:MAG: thymidine kinase [Oceanicaulis sp.]